MATNANYARILARLKNSPLSRGGDSHEFPELRTRDRFCRSKEVEKDLKCIGGGHVSSPRATTVDQVGNLNLAMVTKAYVRCAPFLSAICSV